MLYDALIEIQRDIARSLPLNYSVIEVMFVVFENEQYGYRAIIYTPRAERITVYGISPNILTERAIKASHDDSNKPAQPQG